MASLEDLERDWTALDMDIAHEYLDGLDWADDKTLERARREAGR